MKANQKIEESEMLEISFSIEIIRVEPTPSTNDPKAGSVSPRCSKKEHLISNEITFILVMALRWSMIIFPIVCEM